ncbi:uncharacterized protein PHALS_03950 [Plasmopara halstedii]|uniref:Uncharacterized protein n=1 Tax=Plasmopara halstedii TaxID=4781 RepID=A0A0P1B0V7_PLAHL|nr:uncharacterized protein PHALS_03950 [Plasmopara halstedii]CEG47295.1 hypothetical protein PHALS_03950 [Plasmopara halstedii]|eukprot:XP_024583664.1 hypothetical protein PHALS_03950 [Plasmopara halstedii]
MTVIRKLRLMEIGLRFNKFAKSQIKAVFIYFNEDEKLTAALAVRAFFQRY